MGNYRGLKLTEQVMNVLEKIMDGQLVSIDDSQFGLVPGRGTTDAIFVVRQLQEKYLAAHKRPYMAFVDREKTFDQVPRKVIWWALRKLGMAEWIVWLVQGMYANAQSCLCWWGVHRRVWSEGRCSPSSGLGPLLIIIVLEAMSCKFCSGVPLEDRYADALSMLCPTGVGSNSIFSNGCKHWVHKNCSGFKPLTKDPDYRCTQCQVTAH